MNLQFPYGFDPSGRTAQVAQDQHIRDLIEQVLFTSPGQRVNRPEFGCGLGQLVFSPNSTELATATQFLVQGALQHVLGSLISLNDVTVTANDSQLLVVVVYTVRMSQEQQVAQFSRSLSTGVPS